MKNIKNIAIIIGVVIIGSLVGEASKFFTKSSINESVKNKAQLELNQVLSQKAREVNARLPLMIDSETRLDSTESTGGMFKYNYTLINIETAAIDVNEFVGHMRPVLENIYCSSENFMTFRKATVPVIYSYQGKSGGLVSEFTISVRNCN